MKKATTDQVIDKARRYWKAHRQLTSSRTGYEAYQRAYRKALDDLRTLSHWERQLILNGDIGKE